jgi:tRNA dimethylallyltransferase
MGGMTMPSFVCAHSPPWYLSVVGPTASGKTQLALALARQVPIEIVSVDSALIYRGMDRGTAKPSEAERQAVPHHLIDIREPTQTYSAAQFVKDAHVLIAQIHQRGALPVLVGGTMLYFKALWEGLDDIPATDPAIRAFWQEQAVQKGWPALHAQLMRVDPVTAQRVAPHDAQRIGRALEVFQATGRALSSFWRAASPSPAQVPYPIVSLEPSQRAKLHVRIEQRLEGMWQAGLWQEVAGFYARRSHTGLSADMPAMRCVAYRQVWAALAALEAAGVQAHCLERPPPAPLYAQVQEQVAVATRQLAKRQLTWLRSWPQRHVVACDQAQAQEQGMAKVLSVLPASWRP